MRNWFPLGALGMRDFALPGRSVAYGENGMAATSPEAGRPGGAEIRARRASRSVIEGELVVCPFPEINVG